MLVRIIYWL